MNSPESTPDVPYLAAPTRKGKLSSKAIKAFVSAIYAYYDENKRIFPWRETVDPYRIVISEIMLQQTQTDRVMGKYEQFMAAFPTLEVLAEASFAQVMAAWQGLGYNRRALAIHLFAQQIVAELEGVIPDDPEVLSQFKGIGPSTAASICAFAFNKPTVFIETNIRAVYLHHFFPGKVGISDKQLMPFIAQTLDTKNPRVWYYALMDYGVMLKKMHKNPSRRSAHYAIQSKFEGSDRQVRGLILKMLIDRPLLAFDDFSLIERESDTIRRIINDLVHEGFIDCRQTLSGEYYCLAKKEITI